MMTERIAEDAVPLGTAQNNVIAFRRVKEQNLADSAFPKKSRLYLFTKRVFDVVASVAGLIVLSPILLITAIAIKAEDCKSIIYRSSSFPVSGYI